MNAIRYNRLGLAVVVPALVLWFAAFAGGRAQDVTPPGSPVASPAGSPVASPAGSPVASPAAIATPFTVTSVDIAFEPTTLTIPANTDITINLPNEGAAAHSFLIDALGVNVQQAPGQRDLSATLNAPAGSYEYYCDVPGHKAAGMVGTLTAQ